MGKWEVGNVNLWGLFTFFLCVGLDLFARRFLGGWLGIVYMAHNVLRKELHHFNLWAVCQPLGRRNFRKEA